MKIFYERYAELALTYGVNLQKDGKLYILCPTECEEFGLILAEKAYQKGAKLVDIDWENQRLEAITYKYAKKEELIKIPDWLVSKKNSVIDDNACYIAIDADFPLIFNGLDEEKIASHRNARAKAIKRYHDAVMSNEIRWCVISAPSKDWANLVFNDDENSYEKLKTAIAKTMRIDCEDYIEKWQIHLDELKKRAKYLNEKSFDALHFKNSLGTDITVGLAKNHVWTSAKEQAKDGIEFVANLPTEEIFTAPHKNNVNGTVKSAMPLAYNGNIVDGFSLTFKDGKVVDFSAEKGYETLKQLIETDDGTHYLGEVALIGKNSPIAKSGILFYNTLFDENASCHLALGKGYPTTVKGGDALKKEQLLQLGVNDSVEHVDFMIGTSDLTINGVKGDKIEPIFTDGEWCI